MNKVGRNDPCPCGSKKKFKQCCQLGAGTPAADHRSAAALTTAPPQAFQTALAHHRAGDLALAGAVCHRILATEPRHAEALHLLGMIAFQTARSADAAELIRRAVQINPSNPYFHSNLGIALQNQGKLEEAVASYKNALRLKPDFADVYSNMGKAFRDQGKPGEAAACCRKALALRPDLTEALNNLGNALMDQGNIEEAMACYRKLVAWNPGSAGAHYNMGNALREQGRHDEAVVSFRKALSLQPDLVPAHVNLGNGLQHQGKMEEAAACYRRALSLDPGLVQAHINLGNVYQEQGKLEEAIAGYRTALSLDPESSLACINLGNAFREQGDLDRAIAAYQEAVRIDPDNIVATHVLTALSGGDSKCSPGKYVEHLFDNIAGKFDAHLLQNLKYRVPEELVLLVRDFSEPLPGGWDILDLGCGTGLVGVAMAPYARHLVGVDLSSGMLAKARERSLYHRLERSELLSMMRREPDGSYDAIMAADLFIYIGDMDDVFGEAKRLLRRDGLFGFSLESLDAPLDYKLLPTTRYAHASAYLDKLAAKHAFRICRKVSTQLRLENENPAHGWLVLLGHDRPDR